jgi:hypothetical protein
MWTWIEAQSGGGVHLLREYIVADRRKFLCMFDFPLLYEYWKSVKADLVMYRAIGLVLDSIYRLVCGRQKTTTFRRLDLSPSSGGWGRINLLSWAR